MLLPYKPRHKKARHGRDAPATGKPAKTGDTNVIMEAFRLDTDLNQQTKILGQDITISGEEEAIPDLGGLY